jgi:hypothetical protein
MEPQQALVLGIPADETGLASPTTGTWGFYLKEVGPKTARLLCRVRYTRTAGLWSWIYNYVLLEPAHFIMERKMMLAIKARAEALAQRQPNAEHESTA